ncbi:unnamed protein product [Cylicocyclus nassatus]|uniref:Uncharacterized protein n=1 Tax=Cylicocyclus nassatus TaxID=53992 RepID=A0AA36GWY7_CYLNA|nr:unnamed protein product [Cylicocyclus nassatus]
MIVLKREDYVRAVDETLPNTVGGMVLKDSEPKAADLNDDGQLTYEKFVAQLNYNRPKSRKEADREMAYQILSYIGVDRDGKLSQDEIYNFANVYNKVDLHF